MSNYAMREIIVDFIVHNRFFSKDFLDQLSCKQLLDLYNQTRDELLTLQRNGYR